MDRLWAWWPKGNQAQVSWSTGFGGFTGKLKPTGDGELVGHLKEWCDYRCEGTKRIGKMRVHRINCDAD
jgi:hypothetical protein